MYRATNCDHDRADKDHFAPSPGADRFADLNRQHTVRYANIHSGTFAATVVGLAALKLIAGFKFLSFGS
jgi:hypothetical protein